MSLAFISLVEQRAYPEMSGMAKPVDNGIVNNIDHANVKVTERPKLRNLWINKQDNNNNINDNKK